jgi:GT2 family glycosyltransferase
MPWPPFREPRKFDVRPREKAVCSFQARPLGSSFVSRHLLAKPFLYKRVDMNPETIALTPTAPAQRIATTNLGVVIIGRNEGERLRRCLTSVVGRGLPVVYVDSNSTDGSVPLARAMGAHVVELDMSRPFTMGRGRNEGWSRLREIDSQIRFIQFVDGDCELVGGWLERALEVLESRPDVAVVCGRRRERYPERSRYNRLADIEWNSPVGEAKHCGGDAMIRAEALRQVSGYNPTLIAGEEPDLCVRLRHHNWIILRIDAEMTLHDLAMTRFSQWWKRTERGGFAFAQGVAMHGRPPERHWVHELRSTIFWGLVLPLFILVMAWPTRGASLVLALAYPIQAWRITRRHRKREMSAIDAWIWGWNCILCRFPNAFGALRYWSSRLSGRHQTLIEYKDKTDPPSASDRETADWKEREQPPSPSSDHMAFRGDSGQLQPDDPSRRRVLDPTPTRIEP